MKLSDVDTQILSDENLERGFFTSAFLGLGAGIFVPPLLPIALTGMVTTQAIYWGRRLSAPKDS